MATALKAKVQSTDNPWNTLTLKYGNNRGTPPHLERPAPAPRPSHLRLQPLAPTVAGKLFTEEEDRFLVCMTNELGYGNWDDLKREVRRAPDSRFECEPEP